MRKTTTRAAFLALFILAALRQASADDIADAADPHAVAVGIERTPPQPWPGYGIYLGNGMVITAAHVPGPAAQTQPKVLYDGQRLATLPLKEGSYPDADLTVLKIAGPVPAGLADRHTELCADPPRPDEAVVVSTPEKVTTSTIVRPEAIPPDMRDHFAGSSIKDVYSTGNSGSGVFDAEHRCLLGIMSSKLETHFRLIVNGEHVVRTIGIAKHFVPATDIRTFLAGLPAP